MTSRATLTNAIENGVKSTLKGVNTAIPGYVLKFDPSTQLAELQVAIERIDIDGNAEKWSPIIQCPVHFAGGKFVLEHQIDIGDEGLIIFSQRCIDAWVDQGGVSPQSRIMRTDFSTPIGKGNKYHEVSIDEIGPDLKPFREMMDKYGVPYIGGMFCTDRMKLVPFTKYCNDKYGNGGYETWLGIRADEPKRLGKKDGIRYLAEISEFDKEDILDWWSEQDFDLDIPEWLGNCVFCPKKSNLKLAAAQRDEPGFYHEYLTELYSQSVRYDNKTGHWSKMYRGKQSLQDLIATFDGSTGEEIKSRLRGGKMTDTGSCSESCEVFVCEANQIDMF